MTPYTMVNDSPITIGRWSPRNSDGRYLGMIPLRRALYLSRNTVSVRLLQSVGVERARQLLMDFGLQEDQIPRNFTIALGTPQVLPVQMATGYAAIANGGYRIQPHFISRIEDAFGKTIYEASPEYACIPCINQKNQTVDAEVTPDDEVIEGANLSVDDAATPLSKEEQSKYRQAQRILKSQSAFDMANILRDVIVHGTGRAALKIGRDDIGGKTGTTNDAKDAWFAGFNGKLVAIAWVGFDQPSTLGRREFGGIAALPVWTSFMDKALKGTPSAWVHFDKDAKAPISREQRHQTQIDDQTQNESYGSSPPLARPIFRPAPVAPTRNASNDFDDLPDEGNDLPLKPNKATPPAMNQGAAKREQDSLENLINEVQ